MKRYFIHTHALLMTVWFVFLLSVTGKTWAQKTNAPLSLTDSVYWISVNTDSGVVHAAVAMPEGVGPFPAIIILHGTHGFA